MADPADRDADSTAPFAAHGWRRLALLGAASVVFFVLATANSAGYRFGTGDQAFYIPAIRHAIDPASFPHDAAVVVPQSQLLAFDQIVALVVERAGVGLPQIFLAAYVTTCIVFAVAVVHIGSSLFASSWTTWALLVALTLRHRIAETGVNTFEGTFHPRVLTFALGLAGIAALLRLRVRWAVGFVALGFLVHPTTALWFAIWLGGAALVFPAGRRWALAAAVAGLAAGVWMLWMGPLAHSLAIMDAAWTAPLGSKDYLFPLDDWKVGTWLTNAIAPVVLGLGFVARTRRGLASTAERGVVAGALGLLLLFVASLPFNDARVAIAVQLQTSRVLWPIDFLATAYLVWALVEMRGGTATGSGARLGRVAPPRLRAAVVLGILALGAATRGLFTLRVEHDRTLVAPDLPQSAWREAGRWAASSTPIDAHFLADPGHAWKYDVSFRVAGERDVFLESVKDAAMATYSRDVAVRVTERIQAIGDFETLTPARATELAVQYDIDYLVADRPFPFPVAFANRQFTIYRLRAR